MWYDVPVLCDYCSRRVFCFLHSASHKRTQFVRQIQASTNVSSSLQSYTILCVSIMMGVSKGHRMDGSLARLPAILERYSVIQYLFVLRITCRKKQRVGQTNLSVSVRYLANVAEGIITAQNLNRSPTQTKPYNTRWNGGIASRPDIQGRRASTNRFRHLVTYVGRKLLTFDIGFSFQRS